MKRLVMCPPFYYDVLYELSTNRWMNTQNKPSKQLAYRQWLALYNAYIDYGCELWLIPPKPKLPDMVFAANAGTYDPITGQFVTSFFYHKERRLENKTYEQVIPPIFGLPATKCKRTPPLEGIFFEGQGDTVLFNGQILLVGYGVRTNQKAIEMLKRYIGSNRVIGLPMTPPHEVPKHKELFYHLDTCLLYLPHAKTFILYEPAFSPSALETLRSLGKLLPVTREEARHFVCNSVVMDQRTLFMPWVNEGLERALAKLGYTNLRIFEMSEFIKSGGAVKCLTLEV